MKKTISLLITVAALCGCQTTNTTTQETPVDRLVRVSGNAAYIGTRLYLVKHPEARPTFEMANQTLVSNLLQANYDPAALALALQKLPIREFKGEEGTLLVESAVLLWDEVMHSVTPLNQSNVVMRVSASVSSGFTRALSTNFIITPNP